MGKKKKRIIIIIIVLCAIGAIAGFALTRGEPAPTITTETVALGDIVQTVSETGTVKSQDELDLNFPLAGKVAAVPVKVGDKVEAGQLLAELDPGDLNIKRQEAAANLEVARQNLLKLQAGATAQEIQVARAGQEQARVAFSTAQSELERLRAVVAENNAQAQKALADLRTDTPADLTPSEQAVKAAQTGLANIKATLGKAVDDSVASGRTVAADKNATAKTALDAVKRILDDEDAKDQLSQQDPAYKAATQADYNSAVLLYDSAKAKALDAYTDGADKTQAALEATIALLKKAFSALNNCFSALENSITSSAFTQTELDAYKSTVAAQQTLVAAALAAAQSAGQGLDTAVLNLSAKTAEYEAALKSAEAAYQSALTAAQNAAASAKLSGEQQIAAMEARVNTAYQAFLVAQAQYTRTIAAATREDLALYQARVTQAQAALDSVMKSISDARLTAPIAGTVTAVNYKPGEQFAPSAAKPMAAMLGQNNYQIELLVSEADIAKVKVGNPVEVTLDAYGDDVVFRGQVGFIEPAETVVQDVIYYKVTIDFDPGETPVKSGMTANATVTTAGKSNVLAAPLRAVLDKNGSGKFIRVLVDGAVVERPVTLGLRGDGGMVEILSGVTAGDQVVTYVKAAK